MFCQDNYNKVWSIFPVWILTIDLFSRTARPHDNAVAEALFSIFKKEELYRRHYTSEADLMRGIAHFIAFYNAERPHSTLQYKTPEQAEQDYWNKEKESSNI